MSGWPSNPNPGAEHWDRLVRDRAEEALATADALARAPAGSDQAAFVLAVAALREARAKAATSGPYVARTVDEKIQLAHQIHAGPAGYVWLYIGDDAEALDDTEHIAAEANPAHALAEVALWRVVAEWHGRGLGEFDWCTTCGRVNGSVKFPCPNLLAVVAAAEAYAGGPA